MRYGGVRVSRSESRKLGCGGVSKIRMWGGLAEVSKLSGDSSAKRRTSRNVCYVDWRARGSNSKILCSPQQLESSVRITCRFVPCTTTRRALHAPWLHYECEFYATVVNAVSPMSIVGNAKPLAARNARPGCMLTVMHTIFPTLLLYLPYV